MRVEDSNTAIPEPKKRHNSWLKPRNVTAAAGVFIAVIVLSITAFVSDESSAPKTLATGEFDLDELLQAHRDWLADPALQAVDFSTVDLRVVNLPGAALYYSDLPDLDLSEANLSKADLFKANLSRADLGKVDLKGADVSGANLAEASLVGADLSGANLTRANLSGADLSSANLSRVNLSEAILTGANLIGAQLTCKQLKSARYWKSAYRSPDLACDAAIPAIGGLPS